MAPLPPTGTAATGNALTDAQVTALNTSAQQTANVSADCIWPPSAQVSIPIIPGLYTQSIQIPCLLTYSEARALVGVVLMAAGLTVILGGATVIAAVATVDVTGAIVGKLLGGSGGGGAAKGAGAAAGAAPEAAVVAV